MGDNAAPAVSKFSGLGQKRIAFYTDDPCDGGVAIYVHAMTCAMAGMGLDVSVIQTQADGPLQQAQRGLGVKHHWLPFDTRTDAMSNLTNHQACEQAYAAVWPDVIVFANRDPMSNIAAKAVAIQQSIPFVVVEGFAYPVLQVTSATAVYLHFVREHYARANAVIAVSKETLKLLHTYFGLPEGKGEVIHYGRPAEYFRPPDPGVRDSLRRELGVGPEVVLCLTVGRLAYVKGYDCLLMALEQLRNKSVWKNLHFAWIGGGEQEQEIREKLNKLSVADRVHVLGQRWDMVAWYDASDIFVLPSRYEGMPLSIMEAMAKGLPVLASAVSGIPEEMGETGRQLTSPVVNEARAAAEIASTLERWVPDRQLRRSLGQAARARAEAMFRQERMVEQTMAVIERALLPR
jgi:glycosyltransferase involved in cell wall biosynthesis